MSTLKKFATAVLTCIALTGCANYDIKPTDVLCPVLGATLGAGVFAGGLGGDEGGAMAGGAVAGAALGYFFCMDR